MTQINMVFWIDSFPKNRVIRVIRVKNTKFGICINIF